MYHMTFPFADLILVMDECIEQSRFSITELCMERMSATGVKVVDALQAIKTGMPVPTREIDRIKFVTDDLVVFCALGHSYPDKSLPHVYMVGAIPALSGKTITVTRSK